MCSSVLRSACCRARSPPPSSATSCRPRSAARATSTGGWWAATRCSSPAASGGCAGGSGKWPRVRRPNSLANWRALDAQLGPDCFRVASYNVHGCVGADGVESSARIAQVILELGCDTVGLQEVGTLEHLADALGMQAIASLELCEGRGHFGNALLTRRPVLAVRHHPYAYAGREPRDALDVDLDVGGEKVRVLVTHLGLRPAERRHQVRQ